MDASSEKRYLGIDLGEARVGLASSDELNMLAHPLETLDARSGRVIPRILEVIREKNIGTAVVGMPRNMDGTSGPAAEKARSFIAELQAATDVRVVSWDERWTTVAATRALRASGKKTKAHRRVIDQAAAQILLQGWMDSRGPLAGEGAA